MEHNERRNLFVLVFFVIFYQIAVADKSPLEKEFDARCFGQPDGFSYRNPLNCGEFYHCTFGRSILKQCPNSTYFDEDQQVCDYAENVNCKGAEAVPNCDTAHDGDIFPNPNDCTSFYICNFQKPFLFKCDPLLMFDRQISNCNWADLAKCPEAASMQI